MAAKTKKIVLKVNNVGIGTLTIDGENISNIKKVSINAEPAEEATTVDITLIDVEIEAIVEANVEKINEMKEVINTK